jgi:hypothetical protein
MKNSLTLLTGLSLAILFFFGFASAATLSGTSLQDFFNSKGWGIDAVNDQQNMHPGWMIAPTSLQASLSFFREDPTSDIAFGVYSMAGGELAEIFDVGDSPEAAATLFFIGNYAITVQTMNAGGILVDSDMYTFTGEHFGFYMAHGYFGNYTDILYSDPDLNGGREAFIMYNPSPGQYIFAGNIDADSDFSDLITQAESVFPAPEPASMLLLGSGLIGLGAFCRKKWGK